MSRLIVHNLAPFFIFIKCGDELLDANILEYFELSTYKMSEFTPEYGDMCFTAHDGTWRLLADCWHYTIWHNPSAQLTIEKLAESYDIFACSVGDSYDCFDFVYYRDGKIVRKYSVSDPRYQGGRVIEDFGEPFPSESKIYETKSNSTETVLAIAASLGIKTDYQDTELQIYVKPTKSVTGQNSLKRFPSKWLWAIFTKNL